MKRIKVCVFIDTGSQIPVHINFKLKIVRNKIILYVHHPTACAKFRTCLLVFSIVSCLSSLVSSQLAVPFYAFFGAERA